MFKHPPVTELETEDSASYQLETAIRRNSRVFRAFLEQTREGILLVTAEMTLLRLIHPLLGYPESELLGLSLLSFLHPDDTKLISDAFARLLGRHEATSVSECRAKGPDGAWHWVELQLTDLLDDPELGAILVNSRNIDRRKQSEDFAQRMTAFLACPEYSMFTHDLAGVILDWNSGSEQIFGYSALEMAGRNISILIPPERLAEELAIRDGIAQGRQIPPYAAPRLRRDGTSIQMQVKQSAIGSPNVQGIAQIASLIGTSM
jgi:PAS domain S-box-containing protein